MCSAVTMKIASNQAAIPCFREEAGDMVLLGVRIAREHLFDLSKQIAGFPCLYFRVYENGIYVGKSFGKNGPYERHKSHMDGAQSVSRLGRGRLKEVVLVWDETKTLSKTELGSLEAAYIQHFPLDAEFNTRTNLQTMQIVYGEKVRDESLWAAYVATQRILVGLGLLHEPIRQVLCWKEHAFPAAAAVGTSHFRYLTDVTHAPDSVVVYASSERLSKMEKDRYWPTVKLPNTRHRRIRFIAFYTPETESVSHFAEIESKHKVDANTSSITYDLKLKQPLFLCELQRAVNGNPVSAFRQHYALLEAMLMCKENS